MKYLVISALLAAVNSACSDAETKKTSLILTAMTTHHATAVAQKDGTVTTYETLLQTKTDAVTAATTVRDEALVAGEAAAKALNTTIMPPAEATAATNAEGLLADAVAELDAAVAANAASQAVLDAIAQSQLALDHATAADAAAVHRCITPDQKAHYDAKIAAEKEMWGYDAMKEADKRIFDVYIQKFTDFHQDNDAKLKEQTGYYAMTDGEQAIFDKLQVTMKEKEDYYDEDFDRRVKKDMASAKYQAMTEDEQKEFLNKRRDADFSQMKDLVAGNNIDTMSRKAMDFFDIPADKQDLVNNVIGKWATTRNDAEDGIKSKMAELMNTLDQENLSDEDRMSAMNRIKSIAQQKMGDFMTGMRSDEAKRASDGYFDMDDDSRGSYDSQRDQYREWFGNDSFTGNGWDQSSDSDNDRRGGRGGRGGRDDDDDNNGGLQGVLSQLKDLMSGNGMNGMMEKLQDFMGGNGDDSDDDDDTRGGGEEWSECSPQRGGGPQSGRRSLQQGGGGDSGRGGSGRGGSNDRRGPQLDDQCGRGMCCARVQGKREELCVYRQNTEVEFTCLGANNLAVSAAALASAVYLMM